MKTTDIIRRAGRNLRQAKIRTLLTAMAISVGAFTITLALAAGTGGKEYTDTLVKSNGDMRSLNVFAKIQQNEGDNKGPQKYGETASANMQGVLNDKDLQLIKSVPGVESVTPAVGISADYVVGPNKEKYVTQISVKVDQTKANLVAGTLDNNQPKAGEVLIPDTYAKALGYASPQAAIGQAITIHVSGDAGVDPNHEGKDVTYRIAAIDKKASTAFDYQEGVRLNEKDGQSIYEYQMPPTVAKQYYGVAARVASSADPKVVQDAIESKGYTVFSVQDVQQILFTFVNIVMAGAAGFGALAIIASIFGIINTQYISVLERTQQIGLMKALGARRRDIGRLFRYEAAWVGFLGGVIGTGLALLLGLLNPWIAETLKLEKGTNLLIFKPLYSVILILALMLVAVMAGYFPSRKAAKLDPIEALRTE